jgi:hypothetical protein
MSRWWYPWHDQVSAQLIRSFSKPEVGTYPYMTPQVSICGRTLWNSKITEDFMPSEVEDLLTTVTFWNCWVSWCSSEFSTAIVCSCLFLASADVVSLKILVAPRTCASHQRELRRVPSWPVSFNNVYDWVTLLSRAPRLKRLHLLFFLFLE